MRNFLKFINIVLLIGSLYNRNIYAQLPLSDATWTLSRSDNFNSSTLDPQWATTFWWGPTAGGLEYMSASQVSLTYSPGYVALKTETCAPITYTPGNHSPYNYLSGTLTSGWTIKYGYYEISAKLPIGKGFWPSFWIQSQGPNTCTVVGNDGYYNEIDIMESSGQNSLNNYETGCHYWWRNTSTCNKEVNWFDPTITGLPDLSQEHKYAVFWEPDRITYFIDDRPVQIDYDPTYTPNNPLRLMISSGLWAPTYLNDPGVPDGTTPLPAYMLVNYFNAYQLIPACSTVENICSFSASTYSYAVKKSISIGGSSCTNTINTSSNVNLWATDYILLDEGTTVNDNSSGSFTARLTLCPN